MDAERQNRRSRSGRRVLSDDDDLLGFDPPVCSGRAGGIADPAGRAQDRRAPVSRHSCRSDDDRATTPRTTVTANAGHHHRPSKTPSATTSTCQAPMRPASVHETARSARTVPRARTSRARISCQTKHDRRRQQNPQQRPGTGAEDDPADDEPQRQHERRRNQPPEERLTQPHTSMLRRSDRMDPDERITMIELRTPAEIEAMRPAGRFVAELWRRCGTRRRSAPICWPSIAVRTT
jgi:hypothetical protein